MLRPVYQTVFGGFRSANSVSEFLRLIGIRGKNVRSIRQLEVLNLTLTLCNGDINGKWDTIKRWQSWWFFFQVVVKTCRILASSHVSVPCRTNQRKFGLQRSRQERPKRPKTAKWVILKGDSSLDALFKGYGRDSSCSGLLTCQGTLWNQSETMRTSKKPSGMSKTD